MSPEQHSFLLSALKLIRAENIDQVHFLRDSTHEYLTLAYESHGVLYRIVIDRDGNTVDRLSKSSELRRRA